MIKVHVFLKSESQTLYQLSSCNFNRQSEIHVKNYISFLKIFVCKCMRKLQNVIVVYKTYFLFLNNYSKWTVIVLPLDLFKQKRKFLTEILITKQAIFPLMKMDCFMNKNVAYRYVHIRMEICCCFFHFEEGYQASNYNPFYIILNQGNFIYVYRKYQVPPSLLN